MIADSVATIGIEAWYVYWWFDIKLLLYEICLDLMEKLYVSSLFIVFFRALALLYIAGFDTAISWSS